MSKSNLTPAQLRFVDDLAVLLSTWSMPGSAARLYGYLQVMNEPVSLDDIARDLGVSRSHAHSAAQFLESCHNARRLPSRGSKRALYVATDDPGAPLRRQSETLARMAGLISASTDAVADGAARARLARLAAFHGELRDAMDAVIQPPHGAAAAA